jgi:polycomb protein EED
LADPSSTSVTATPERKYDLGDPFMPLKSHHSVLANTSMSKHKHFATTQIAWSPDGTWMVGVGDMGMMCIFHRDKDKV